MAKKIVLLKLTGEILARNHQNLEADTVIAIADQIKKLADTHYFGIVIGGGNFFRGTKQGNALGITPSVGHQVGMLATMMNGLIVKDLFEQHELPSSLFCAVPSPEIGAPISQQGVKTALAKGHCLIFSGGTGNPFFSTDTTAVLRGLQIDAHEIWKGTLVNGIYDADPKKNAHAQRLPFVTYQKILNDQLGIMDATAIALAQQHNLPIRVFNIFENEALLKAAHNDSFSSIVHA
jgi:uridylate kinase